MKQGTVLVAGNGDLKYPGYPCHAVIRGVKITKSMSRKAMGERTCPSTSPPAAGRENQYGSESSSLQLISAFDLLQERLPTVGRGGLSTRSTARRREVHHQLFVPFIHL